MIKHLNHELIDIKSNIYNEKDFDYADEYLAFKCIRCEKYYFLYKRSNFYFAFKNRKDYTGWLDGNQINWELLKLTCEEEMIKGLLE